MDVSNETSCNVKPLTDFVNSNVKTKNCEMVNKRAGAKLGQKGGQEKRQNIKIKIPPKKSGSPVRIYWGLIWHRHAYLALYDRKMWKWCWSHLGKMIGCCCRVGSLGVCTVP